MAFFVTVKKKVDFFSAGTSLRGGTTKQSRVYASCLDCFVPRNDAKRRCVHCLINRLQNASTSSFDDHSLVIMNLPLLMPHIICQS